MVLLACAGCAQSSAAGNSGTPAASTTSHVSPAVTAAQKICRWTIADSTYRTHTTPGSYTARPPGSCPSAELAAAVRLADGLRSGGARGTGVCQLLASEPLYNAQRVANQTHVSCGQAAIEPARSDTIPAAQRFSHLSGVLLNSSSPGPPRWFGFLAFAPPNAQSHPHDPRYSSLIVAIIKLSSGRWAINQIGYQF